MPHGWGAVFGLLRTYQPCCSLGDKVSINSAAVTKPSLVTECSDDSVHNALSWLLMRKSGRRLGNIYPWRNAANKIDAVEWAKK